MAGVDSAGLGEVIQNILSRFSEEEKGRLVKVCPFRKAKSISHAIRIEYILDGWPLSI
jgi:hypothetical protein